jgi:hypothetical protein
MNEADKYDLLDKLEGVIYKLTIYYDSPAHFRGAIEDAVEDAIQDCEAEWGE